MVSPFRIIFIPFLLVCVGVAGVLVFYFIYFTLILNFALGLQMTIPLPLSILCLHDAYSDAQQLKNEFHLFGKRLYEKHGGIDLVYINSPIALQTETERVWYEIIPQCCSPSNALQQQQIDANNIMGIDSDSESDSSDDHSDKTYETNHYIPPTNNDNNNNMNIPYYRGLDASLQLLQQVWSSRPFWGVIGVGQGAAVAALFTLLLQSNPYNNTVVPPPSFVIFIRGQTLLPENECLIQHLPCLHIMERDNRPSTLLAQQFVGTIASFTLLLSSSSSSSTTNIFSTDVWNIMGRYIIQQRKHQMTGTSKDLIVLQNALYYTEQQAAERMALEIAKNPPAPLMAIIQPQHVAGWKGNKRRQPNEEGGGAPCPSEFLLKRKNRPNSHKVANGAASRVHPNEQQKLDKE